MFQWLKSGFTAVQKVLQSTRNTISKKLSALFGRKVDESLLEEVEEILFEADLGVSIVKELVGKMRNFLKSHKEASCQDLLQIIEDGLLQEMVNLQPEMKEAASPPTVVLIVGANGNGKTTSIAKLAYLAKKEGKKTLLAAADTFRAGAQEQLAIWAERLGSDIIRGNYQADPASVAFDAVSAAASRASDLLLIDTAGRLENKFHLMREIEKVKKSCNKALPGAPHEVLLVLDATIGQNGIEQAKVFQQATGVSGLILTKIDGSAKGGVVIAIQKQLGIPVKFLGLGERLEDFVPFHKKSFVHSMLFEDVSQNG